MDPNNRNGELDQDNPHGSVSPSPSNTATTAAVATTIQSDAPTRIADGMLQVPDVAMMDPPVPDSQLIGELENEISDQEDSAGKKQSRGKKKKKSRGKRKPREKLDVIEDDDPPPLPAAAMAASMNNEEAAVKGKARKGPEQIGGDTDAPPDLFSSLHDGEDNNLKNKPAAVAQSPHHSRTQAQPHATVYSSRPNRIVQNQASTSSRPLPDPIPHSMPPRPDIASNTQAPSAPILEATPVDNEIYDAEVVPAMQDIEMGQGQNNNNVGTGQTESEEEVPWWKRYQRCIIFGIVLVLCVVVAVTAMGTLLATQGKSDEATTNNDPKGVLGGGADPPNDETPPSKSPSAKTSNAPTVTPTTILHSILSSQTKLLPNDGAGGDEFGRAVAVSGNTVVVGAERDDDNGSWSGSAYVYIREGGTWKQQAKLLPNDGAAGDYFGNSVSISGDTVVVGARLDDGNGSYSGSAYVFIREGGTWIQQAKLLPNDGAANDYFGEAVSVSGDTVVVGAYQDDDNGSNSGSAYVFIREGDTWTQEAKLLPNDGAVNDRFGTSVAVDGDTVVVGASQDDDNSSASGSAYVYIREGDTWIQQAKLLPNDRAAGDYFGRAVSVSGDTVVVSAYDDDDNGSDSGSAYIFIQERGTWKQQAKLLANDGAEGDNFGIAVAVDGHTVVVGAHWDNDNGSGSGSAYIFIREGGTWKQQAKLLPNDGAAGDKFGRAVSVSGDTVVVGAHWYDDNGIGSGSSYVFIRKGDTWKQQAKLLSNDGRAEDDFGVEVSVSGGTVVVGARSDDNENGWDSGSAYVFSL